MHKAKRNIATTLISQLVSTVCGMVIPGTLISVFGSVMYGIVTSITQFLSYISLLEGGIARVARAELYGPLAKKDNYEISRVYYAIGRFFMFVGVAFMIYTLFLSVGYYDLANVTETGRGYIFILVWIISAGTLAKYMGGLTNLTLINADQRQYVGNLIVTTATIFNALLVVVLSKAGADLLVVKTVSCAVYVAQPIGYAIYVKKHYDLRPVGKNRSKLKQKWTGMGQHVAYFLHTNTDIVILTLFAGFQYVAVYAVYRLVISSVRKIVQSFTSGMEAAFGEMIAKKEQRMLQNVFFKYKHLLSTTSVVLFGSTGILIVPFVLLYTAGVTDANYFQPTFAVLLLLAEAVDCFMHPCCSLPISANKLKETSWGSYGEAVINISLSLVLVHWNPLIGVALATLLATVFKSGFYLTYACKNILKIRISELLKNCLITVCLIGLFAFVGASLMTKVYMESYFIWILWGFGTAFITLLVTIAVYAVFYPTVLKNAVATVSKKLLHR